MLRFWDVATGRSTREAANVEAVRIDSGGRYAVTLSLDPTDESFSEIRLWDLTTRKQVGTPWLAHAGGADAAAFSPDGRFLATGGRDGEIQLWDVPTRRAIGNPIKAHLGAVTSVVFSPDGKILASASDDGTVRLWATDLPADPRKAVCAVAGRSLTKEEWQRHLQERQPPMTWAAVQSEGPCHRRSAKRVIISILAPARLWNLNGSCSWTGLVCMTQGVQYAQGGGITSQEQRRREEVRLSAAVCAGSRKRQ